MSTSSSRLGGLDSLRALAAIAVLSYHVAEWSKFAFAGPLGRVLWELKGGVAVFFVISGAVLYLPYARAIRDRAPAPDWRRYARRRVVRIVPAYWVALTAVAIGPFSAGVLGAGLWRYYGLSQIYSPDTVLSGLGGAWSLCVEVSFYAALPLLARGTAAVGRRFNRPGAQLALIGLLAAASIVMRSLLASSLTAPPDAGLTLAVALPGFLDWFAIGMALAVLAAHWEAGRGYSGPLAALASRPGWCVLLGVLAFLAGVPAQHGDMFLPWYGLVTHVALGAGSALLVVAAIGPQRTRRAGRWARLLRSGSLTWLGTISYGIYLWNRVLIQLISRQPAPRGLPGAALLWLVVLAGAVILGAASWYLLERPLQRALRARERREDAAGRGPELDGGVQPTAGGLNPAGLAVDHLA